MRMVRLVDPRKPDVVTCEFTDAEGRCHTFEDKVPLFSDEAVSAKMTFPRPGIVRCEEVQRWRDMNGRELVKVNTSKPDNVVTTEGLCEFTVLAKLVSSTSE
jgi:hypothetical protein